MFEATPIEALTPSSQGHHFVAYGDCCCGQPGGAYEANFAAVNAVLRRLDRQPQFILFPGDHVYGLTDDREALRAQWCYFFEHEMAWLDRRAVPLYSTTSNHNTYSAMSEQVWRDVFADLPRNGPPGQEGLSYWLRRGDLLLVAANTAFSELGGSGHVESAWLEEVLTANADAVHKLVMGHHPVWPVNGYDQSPLWCIDPAEGAAFWAVLARHGVTAYVCSHVIAFDAQAHDGVLQLTTGGAGTRYGPNGFMDGPEEYHHLVQMALDAEGLICQTRDIHEQVRERVQWQPVRGRRPARLAQERCDDG